MFKFLRKYNKWILAVGGTLLMIVFLIPQALEGLMQEAGVGRATRATIDGPDGPQRVPAREWDRIRREYQFISQIERQSPVLPAIGRIQSSAHWYLLSLEAERAGLVANTRSLPLTDEQVLNLQLNFGESRDIVLSAFAKIEGITRLLDLYLDAGELSDRRLRAFAARSFHGFEAQMIVFEADADVIEHDPSESELQAQFDKYKNVKPGEGPQGFGYLLPNRFKLEWIRIPAADVRSSIEEGERMDSIALRRHWQRNPDGQFPPVERGAPVPDEVRDDLLNRLTAETLDEIVRFGGDRLRAGRRGLPERDGYVVLPNDWDQRMPSLRAIAEEIQERFETALPEYTAVGDRWLTLDDIDELGSIAEATTERFGARPLGLFDLIGALREFGGSPTVIVQSRIAGPPLRAPNQDTYIFRVTEIDRSREPRSVDEVRDQLVHDLRRAAHFQMLVETASALEQEALDRGLLGVSLSHDKDIQTANVSLTDLDLLLQQFQMGNLPRITPTRLPVIGRHRPTTETLIDFSLSLPSDMPINEVPLEHRLTTVPVEDHLALLLVQVEQLSPLTREDYRDLSMGGLLRTLYISEEIDGLEHLRQAFSFDSLRVKYNFQLQILDDDLSPEELEELDLIELE